jgi:glycine/serine hydroxymethyltransferase
VLLAMGNWLSDKYAEGTVGQRFYAGCEMVDRVESIAAGHAKALFGAEHAYVQPHSGIDANLVAFWAILARRVEEPALRAAGVKHVNDLAGADWERLRGELHSQRMLGMALDAGGHLTHGFRPNISGKLFEQSSYGTDPVTEQLDYDAIAAQALAEGLLRRGVRLVTGGTSNHLVLADVASSFGLTGRQAESALLEAGVVTNRNSIPRDANGAWYTSGIRMGTPALTTLGFGPDELDEIADIFAAVLSATAPAAASGGASKAKYVLDAKVAADSRDRCAELLGRHPLYPGIEL